MKLAARDYQDAASARVHSAMVLYHSNRYAESMYLSGLAVECLLRACALRRSPTFDARHDLPRLLKEAGPDCFGAQFRRVTSAVAEVWSRWKNNHRYVSPLGLRRELVRDGLHRGIRGDILKENARLSLTHAVFVVKAGVEP